MASAVGTLFYSESIAVKHARVLRGVTGAVLNLTNRCNLRCLHCFNSSTQDPAVDELSDDEVMGVVDELARTQPYNVCFSGGEPLLRRRLLLQSAERLAAAGIRTSLVTNGWLITPEVARELYQARIGEVEVSLDGATPATHDALRGLPGAHRRALAAIHNLAVAGVETAISFTLTQDNGGEFADLCRQAAALGARCILTRPMLPMGTALSHSSRLVPTPSQYRHYINTSTKLQREGFKIMITDPLNHIIMLRGQACVPYVEIKANGALIPTPYIQMSFGNLRRHSLAEYWQAGLYRVWTLPAYKRIMDAIYCAEDLPDAIALIPPSPAGKLSHIDLVDDWPEIWAG